MAITAACLLESAKELRRGSAEIDHRNAASRAYYAAFHRCLPIARGIGLSESPEMGVHRNLIDTLIAASVGDKAQKRMLARLGYMLNACRAQRVRADYNIDEDFEPHYAQEAIEHSERVFVLAASLP